MNKAATLFSLFITILVLAMTSPAYAQQHEDMAAITTRLHQIEAQLDKILVPLQRMEGKSKREEYFAGCVPEATQCSAGGLCGANEASRWVSEDPRCGSESKGIVFGCYCKG